MIQQVRDRGVEHERAAEDEDGSLGVRYRSHRRSVALSEKAVHADCKQRPANHNADDEEGHVEDWEDDGGSDQLMRRSVMLRKADTVLAALV